MNRYITTLILIIILLITVVHFTGNKNSIEENKETTTTVCINNNFVEETKEIEESFIFYNIPLCEEVQRYIWNECEKYQLSYELVLAVIQKESNFNHQAVSSSGADRGLFQLNKGTYPWIAQQLGIKNFNVFNVEHNIQAGVWYLNYIKTHWEEKNYKDEELTILMLNSYNQGIGGCTRYVQNNGYSYYYAKKVLEYKEIIEDKEMS